MTVVMTMSGGALADETSSALRDFGWQGRWSPDCAANKVFSTNVIPLFSVPTTTVVSNEHHVQTVYNVIHANMLSDKKMLIELSSQSKTEKSESNYITVSVIAVESSRMVVYYRHTYTSVSNNGEPLRYQDGSNIIDGVGRDGKPLPALEKCRD